MVQPLRESRDRYEELKQIDDAMNEVGVSRRRFSQLTPEDAAFPSGAEKEEREPDHGRQEEVDSSETGEAEPERRRRAGFTCAHVCVQRRA